MRTIRANLRHWLPEQRTVVPERLIGYGRRSPSLARDVVIALDQSGSMADSVVHASLFACLLARMPALRTSLVVFDTAAVDLTDRSTIRSTCCSASSSVAAPTSATPSVPASG